MTELFKIGKIANQYSKVKKIHLVIETIVKG